MFKVLKSSSDAAGTSLQGYVHCYYQTLVDLFGEPIGPTPDGKTQAEWILKFQDGTVVAIYDYKEDVPPTLVTEWHIGGKRGAVEYLRPLFPFASYFEDR